MSYDFHQQAVEQHLNWSLHEVAGGEAPPDVTDKVLMTVQRDRPASPSSMAQVLAMQPRWLLTAALVVLAIATLFGVHRLAGKHDTSDETNRPHVQDGKRHHVRTMDDIANLPADARIVTTFAAGDELIQAIAKRCGKLESLHANTHGELAAPLTDRVFSIAASLANLRELHISAFAVQNDLTGKGIEQLASLPLLHSLTITFAGVRPHLRQEAYAALARLPSLRTLDLSRNMGLNDEAIQAIVRCPGLRQLSIADCNNVTAAGLASVVQLPLLESLNIQGLKCSWALLGDLQPKRLRVLNACNTNFRNEHLSWLPHGLRELSLSNTHAKANTLDVLARHTPELHMLGLSSCDIQDVGIRKLSSFAKLRELNLTNCPFTSTGLQQLQQMEQLCELHISALNWLLSADLEPLLAAGINVHVTKGKGHDDYLDHLRQQHADALNARRERGR